MPRSVKRSWVGSSANVPRSRKRAFKSASGTGTSGSDQTDPADDPEIVPVPSPTNNADSRAFSGAAMTPSAGHERYWPERWLPTGDARPTFLYWGWNLTPEPQQRPFCCAPMNPTAVSNSRLESSGEQSSGTSAFTTLR